MNTVENILLVTVDCLRPDHLPTYGYERETAPFVDDLASDGLVFTNAFAMGPGTSPSFPAILTGTYPFDYGGYNGVHPERTPVAERLSAAGVLTAGVHSNTFLSRSSGYERGFDRYESFHDESSGESIVQNVRDLVPSETVFYRLLQRAYRSVQSVGDLSLPYAPADQTTDRAIDWVDDFSTPFFLWVHYLDPHEPHRPPDRHARTYFDDIPDWRTMADRWSNGKTDDSNISEPELQRFRDAYDAEIAFVDEQIQRLFAALADRGLLEETLVVFTADHGEEFLEHGSLSHTPKLYDELIHVPLIVQAPGLDTGCVDDLVSLVDIPPTMLEMLDIDVPGTYRGSPIQRALAAEESVRDHIFAEVCHEFGDGLDGGRFDEEKMIVACRTPRYKYIRDEQRDREEFYDLSTDPDETDPEGDVPASVRSSLRESVEAHLEELYTAAPVDSGIDADPTVQRRLSDLGYVD